MNDWIIGFCVGISVGLILGLTLGKKQKQWNELSKTEKLYSYIVMAFIFLVALTGLVFYSLH